MRLTNLTSILRNAGLQVLEEPGWKERGSNSFGPLVGMTIHETRGSKTSSVAGEINVLINGRPGLSGPISQLFLSRNGAWHIIASGTCHHNKVGWAGPNKGFGNDNLLGIEAQHALNESWTTTQYDSYVIGIAALCKAFGISVNRVAGHFEHQPGDKSDPAFNMDTFRQRVALAMREDDEMKLTDVVKLRTGGDVAYSSNTTTVEGILTSTNYYTVLTRNIAAETLAEVKKQTVLLTEIRNRLPVIPPEEG